MLDIHPVQTAVFPFHPLAVSTEISGVVADRTSVTPALRLTNRPGSQIAVEDPDPLRQRQKLVVQTFQICAPILIQPFVLQTIAAQRHLRKDDQICFLRFRLCDHFTHGRQIFRRLALFNVDLS